MSSPLDYLELCRLCLVKDRVQVPIFEDDGDVNQIFLKIHACLPVKVSRDDKLPRKICSDCSYKLELFYQFWNTTANAEKQLLQWLGEDDGLDDKQQGYVTEVLDPNVMKQEGNSDSRLDNSVMQVSGHQNMDINMIENMSIITMPAGSDQQFTTVPMGTRGTVQTVQVPGPSTQTAHDQTGVAHLQEVEVDQEDEDNMDDGCDNDDGLPVKEETDEGDRSLEQSYVSLPCDEAGPSGLQQQKISEMSEITIQQTADGDHKTGYYVTAAQEDEMSTEQSTIKVYSADSSTSTTILIATTTTAAAHLRDGQQTNGGEHLMVVSTDSHMLHCCPLCDQAFVDEVLLGYHLKAVHPTEPKLESVEQEEQSPTASLMIYACEQCGVTFAKEASLLEHQVSCCGSASIAPQQPPPAQQQKIYQCEICEYSTPHRQNLGSHQRRHSQNYKYQCELCGARFYARNNYQEHVLAVHSKEKPFQCDKCPATFRYRQGLRLHAKLHQPDYVPPQKKHACDVCNKRFCRRQVLMVHMRTHGNTGAPLNEFVCNICGKAVSSKTYLTVHVRKHTGEKPHVCDLCGKGFISQNYLSVHRRTHTGERPHKCTHCEKSFTQRTTLVVHLRSHTGDRPYPCTFCTKSFASKTMLNSHLKTHAKQNARARQDQETQLHLQQQRILLSPEEEQQALFGQQQQQHLHHHEIVSQQQEVETTEVTLPPT
ncbi:zinc finger protein 28-like isoform X7 [Phymastichus coffea]|uniref:zinc finger protein 28-like isoform X7 n=1 Tax=Phymastichus coffea TaxID=108790 RepID=UPI00273CD931|nr:zinc finger protein 28-like isoform X7 [Phymastichus coffea]